ncbi:MAG: hypothetical protein AUH92_03915 [Acidobacteria bacterium 13_1_40CM_4_69_4]|nr:MAG: hypothetical protein AUH92_03915 [Acidobacteria bacterium 13_1_40CM_4_69_4]
MMRSRRFHAPLFVMLAACAAAPSAFADQVVYFVNGKAIMVKSVEKGDKFTVLEMDGGGRMGVPTDQIVKIEEYVVSAPGAPQPAAPVAAVVAPAQPPAPGGAGIQSVVAQPAAVPAGAQAGSPSNVPFAGPAVPGPGVGGRSTIPNGGVAGLRPLDVGGSNTPPGGMQRPFPQLGSGPIAPGPGNPMLGGGAARRNNFGPGRPFQGRPGVPGGRGARLGGQNFNMPNLQPAGQSAPAAQSAPAQTPATSAQPPPPPNPTPEEAPPPPDDSANDSSDQNAPPEGEPSGDSPGGAS